MRARNRLALFTLAVLVHASPAFADWTRVPDIPITDVFSVWVNGDTITAGTDTAAFVSTDAGGTWKRSAKVAANVTSVQAVRFHKGRVYAGTFGQGMFMSTDMGDTWVAFSQGLSGGIANSHLFISDLLLRGDTLIAATSGAGPYVRNLNAGTWSHFGNVFEPNQSSNMNAVAAGGARMFACAGANGTVFFRDPGAPDWTLSWLNNVGIVPGLGALTSIWTGTRWIVGSNAGVFHSALGQSPWTFSDPGLGTLFSVGFALRGQDVFALFGTGAGSTFSYSRDDGATWQELEMLPFVFTYNIASHGNTLYAARFDGLWRRSVADVSVPDGPASRLRFAVAGAHPVRGDVRFRFELPEAGRAAIDVFDLAGRRAGEGVDGSWSAGPHEITWSTRNLRPGVYLARLSAAGRAKVARLVFVP